MQCELAPPDGIDSFRIQQTPWKKYGRRLKAAVLYLRNEFGCSNVLWRDQLVWLYRVKASCHTCSVLITLHGSLIEVWLDERDVADCRMDPAEVYDCFRRLVNRQKRKHSRQPK